MTFSSTAIHGVFLINLDTREDDRGNFRRMYSLREFSAGGTDLNIVEINQAQTKIKGVVRGLHWQKPPSEQIKVFQCLQGRIYDVLADVRPDSPTYGKWLGTELAAGDGRLLYAPAGLAHGYQSLTDACLLQYMVSEYYAPECESGIRWNDPLFKISWPLPPEHQTAKDKNWPDFVLR